MKGKHDWQKIKHEYISGIVDKHGRVYYLTLDEVGERNGCVASYVRKRAAEEKWTEHRNVYLAKLEQKELDAKTSKLAKEQANFDFKIAKTTNDFVEFVVREISAWEERWKKNHDDRPSADKMERLSRVLKNLQDIGKRAYGEETPTQKPVDIEDVIRELGAYDHIYRDALNSEAESLHASEGEKRGLDTGQSNGETV